MNVALHLRLLAAGCIAGAVWLGWQVAEGQYILPALAAGLAVLGSVTWMLRISVAAFVLGAVFFGYLVGNRGFAQLMPIPQLPILPAEIALLVAGGWIVVQGVLERRLPVRRDALNFAVLAWLIIGTCRVIFDVRSFGLLAIRDYAMVYYALFFYLAQYVARDDRSRQFLIRVLIAASLAQPVAMFLSEIFPEFFFTKFVVRGAPLIYFKGDLALTFMAVNALVLAFAVNERHRRWTYPMASLALLFVIGNDNRASMLGALVALGWLAVSRARRFTFMQAGVLAAALFVLTALATLTENRWATEKFLGLKERISSLGDRFGHGTYLSAESSLKGDNNRFRSLWWRVVVDETMSENPVFGLGFGHDLARDFLLEYNPEIEDFTARSPHSIVVSTIGRMGLAGLVAFLVFAGVLVVRTWRTFRSPDTTRLQLGLWAAVWVILVSACFGVVLEGPMGAVVFWILLGMANAATTEPTDPDTATVNAGTEQSLNDTPKSAEVATSS